MMKARIVDLSPKTLIGMKLSMTFDNDKTRELWQKFMPKRKEIVHKLNNDLYSLQKYPFGSGPMSGKSDTPFEKWAAVEVAEPFSIPTGMEALIIPEGRYAVFIHHGPAKDFLKTFHFIFNGWLPGSEFEADDRAHFEVMTEKYRPDDPMAEEEVWIPIKLKV